MNKATLRENILAHLRAALALQVNAAQLARDEAISEESRAENQYDTHSLEAGYLAEGQARQAGEIEESIKLIAAMPVADLGSGSPVALGALVEMRDAQDEPTWYYLVPRSGGLEIPQEGHRVLVVTPQSPLGRRLLGRYAGESVSLPAGKGTAASQIVAVR